MRKKIIFGLIVFLSLVIALSIIIAVKDSSWYHWKEIEKFKSNPRKYAENDDGKMFWYHLNKLISTDEVEYRELIFDKTVPSIQIFRDIKNKFPDLVWAQMFPLEEEITDKNGNYMMKVWARPNTMIEIKTYKYIAKPSVSVKSDDKSQPADAKPAEYNLKLDDNITIQGRFAEWNGWPPSIRVIAKDGGIIGIGMAEEDSVMPDELKSFKNIQDWEVTLELTYIGNVGIPYYEKPLQCFKIVKIIDKKMLK